MRTWLAEGLAPLKDGFLKDLGRLLVVTAVVLSLVAATAAWAVNAYFGQTVANLIGGIGEYDFMLHVGAAKKLRAGQQLAAYLPKAFPGSRFKTGLTVAGQANFFVALPPELRTRAVMENVDATFGNLPGYSGHTTLVEPSVVVHDVAPGAIRFFLDKLEEVPGVSFTFADGQDLVVAVDKRRRAEDVERGVQAVLGQYRLVEARFPMGYKVPDLRQAGQQVVTAVNHQYGGGTQDVTRSDRGDDYRAFLASLTEMRRFLLSYASDIMVKVDPAVKLQPGDNVVTGASVPPPGSRLGPQSLRVMITGVEDGLAHGVAVNGDTDPPKRPGVSGAAAGSDGVIRAGKAYRVNPGDKVGAPVGTATIHNQRYALSATVDESLKLLDQLQVLAKHADTTASRVQLTLDSYQRTLDQIGQAQSSLTSVRKGLSGPLSGLSQVRTQDLLIFLNRAVGGIDDLLAKVGGVSEAKTAMDLAAQAVTPAAATGAPAPGDQVTGPAAAQVAGVQDSLAGLSTQAQEQRNLLSQIVGRLNPVTALLLKWRAQAQALALQVGNFGLLAENSGNVTQLLEGLSKATDSTVTAMEAIDVPALKQDLEDISRRLEGIAQLDVAQVTRQMRYVQNSLPNLKDEELGRSIRLIDRYLGGQVIPGERLQFLVPAKLPVKGVLAQVRATAGDRVSVSASPAGSLKPDLRGVLFQVLGKARSTVAGLVAIALVAAVLMLDHALLISAFTAGVRSRKLPSWWRPAAGAAYGTGVGAWLLTVVFALSGARLPFFGWPAVAGVGAGLGLLTAALARKLAPVNLGELEAGQALGLSYARMLREIVIPEGRPGLLSLLNRRELIFREPALGHAGGKR